MPYLQTQSDSKEIILEVRTSNIGIFRQWNTIQPITEIEFGVINSLAIAENSRSFLAFR